MWTFLQVSCITSGVEENGQVYLEGTTICSLCNRYVSEAAEAGVGARYCVYGLTRES